MRSLIAITICALLAGCASTRTGSLCTAGPIVLDRSDVLSRSTGEQIVALNNSGEQICGWRAPR